VIDANEKLRVFLGSAIHWSYLLRTSVVFVSLLLVWRMLDELDKNRFCRSNVRWTVTNWLVIFGVGVSAFVLWITIGPLFRLGSVPIIQEPPWPSDAFAKYVWIFVRLFGAAILVPIVEEVFWRSYLMRRLDTPDFLNLSPENASKFAVLASSFVFALAHKEILAGFITGIIYARLYQKLGSLWAPIFSHALTNLCLGLYVLYTGNYEFW
jgi:uncharacterized protein